MENRKRNVHLHVMVTPDELAAIHERMAEAGISNAGGLCTENGSERVYPAHRPCARKRADLSATALFQQSQSGRRTRTTHGVYPEEIDGLKRDYEKLWGEVSKVLRELSELVAK
ncbi:hypothetical protein ROSEINA2194_02941 [Roseburia inulinivorans DSM 16841]|uniref:Uncharacterized protein n=1 Tax=Roseburia inulinivorans DSM 16841 TaxID=622312 RepID=C0FW15_9FIRM|nr:hypothetical protein ROSEINA2194_02941 [Roseburia inulinivorans DSM 16841]